LAWTIKYSDRALKQSGKLNTVVARRIDDYLRQRVIAKIEDENVQVFIVKVAHRKDIYENYG